jgi:hypothetical protein
MTLVKRSRVVAFSCEKMFNLVNQIEDYPDFLPYIASATVHHRDESEVQATLEIAAAGMNKSFTTRNRLQQNKMIEILASEGIVFTNILIDKSFPADNLPTRKPGLGLLGEYLTADYDLKNSFVIIHSNF